MATSELKPTNKALSGTVPLGCASTSPGYHPEGYSKDSDVLVKQAQSLMEKGAEQIASVEKYLNQG